MILTLLALAVMPPAPAAAPDADTIVVTATMPALRQAVELCKQGACPPRQDIIASIRYAEAVFRTGRYREARRILQGAIARDKGSAASEPVALAALYEATVTTALHDGDQDVARKAGGARMRVLRDHFGVADPRLLQAELDQADMLLGTGQADEAAVRYPIIARRAEAAHLPTIHAAAVLRQAAIAHARGSDRAASDLLTKLAGDADEPGAIRLAGRAMLARFARERGDARPVDTLVGSFLADPQPGPPVLVWQPPLSGPTDPTTSDDDSLASRRYGGGDFMTVGWADVGFLIKADGTVETPEILRGSISQGWSRPIIGMIAGRRYLPAKAGSTPFYRIERWTLTGAYCVPTGSFIRQRACNPHFVQLDLTPEPPAAS